MRKRKITPGFVLFYILFSPDTWRLVIGILAAWLLVPGIIHNQDFSTPARIMIWIMLIAIGWAVSSYPGRKIALLIKKVILKDRI